jgi:virginiamycin B lyase
MRRHRFARRSVALASALAGAVPLSGLIVATNPSIAGASISIVSDASIFDPERIVSGPDGALWFTDRINDSVGRITTSGAVTIFTDPSINYPRDITPGPDGALWFANHDNDSIGRITTAGVVSNFTDATISVPWDITAGPDGALWFPNSGIDSIGRITTAGVVTNFTDPAISTPLSIAAGPDGALWFTNFSGSIGRITTSGSVTKFSDSRVSQPGDIEVGPDGALWFANFGNDSIGRITTAGVVSIFTDPSISGPFDLTSGPDNALWFTNATNDSIGRITTSGSVTNFTDSSVSGPRAIGSGPDGALWFANVGHQTIPTGNKSIGRFPLPKATDTCSTTQSCLAAVNVVASASSPSESVVVTGKPNGAKGTVKVKLAPGTLACPTVPPGTRAVGTLTNTGFSKKTKLRLTVTLRHATGTSAAQVCFRKKQPFKSQSPATSKPGGGSGLLLGCKATKNVAPCVLSSKYVDTSVVVTFVVPGGDPDFSIQWPAGSRQSWLSQFGQGTVGKRFAAQLQVKGGVAPYRWKVMSGKLPKGITLNASTGAIAGTPSATGKFPVVVQATDVQRKTTKPEKVPIVINARP